jgi:hypothetical protein
MFKQIRTLIGEEISLEGPSVEIDEMYAGGKRKNGTGRPMVGDKTKTLVMGIVERKGRGVARVIPDTKSKTLLDNVKKYVLPELTVTGSPDQSQPGNLCSWRCSHEHD